MEPSPCFLASISLFLLVLGPAVGRVAPTPNPDFVVIGDSLSDTGNLLKLSGGIIPAPPASYYNGRFSDGPIWVDFLGNLTKLKTVLSLAVGGATACTANSYPQLPFIPSGAEQVATLVSKYPKNSKRIVSLWIGNNDLLSSAGLSLLTNPNATKAQLFSFLDSIVNCTSALVDTLVQNGEKRIVLTSLGTLDLTPTFHSTPLQPILQDAVQYVSAKYQAFALTYKKHGAKVLYEDFITQFLKIYNNYNTTTYGFTNETDDCLVLNSTSSLFPGTGAKSLCTTPSKYMWFVTLHPTSRVHAYAASSIVQALKRAKWI